MYSTCVKCMKALYKCIIHYTYMYVTVHTCTIFVSAKIPALH